MILLFISILLLTCLLFYGLFLLRTAYYFRRIRPTQFIADPQLSVTVIIPARNESMSISACIEALLTQQYPRHLLDIVVVNDHSEDDTATIVQAYSTRFPQVRLLHLPMQQGRAYKKAAVTHGIAHSTGDIILTTDADCTAGPQWVHAMASQFTPDTGMVSGPVQLTSTTFAGHLQSLEFMGLIAVGAGSIEAGTPNMCNGANLAYRRETFDALGGFAGVDHLASGDDEFLMHRMAASGRYKIRFAKLREAIVYTPPQSDLAAFVRQRRRWVSKSTQYEQKSVTLVLIAAYLAILSFPVLTVFACFNPLFFWMLLSAFFWKTCCEFSVLTPAATFFRVRRLLRIVPLEQFLHIPYILYIGIAGNIGGYKWKGRKVK